ncbi:MAG: RNA polymerase sigma factor, partial [Candidatus Limnocylindrales bacterium]
MGQPTGAGYWRVLEARTSTVTDVTVTTDRATARAFVERLYAAHHGEIYAYLARMLRDDELAADLTQETFVKAYRA